MAEKISKLAIEVDLSCDCCYKKIQKILCKLQERGEKITTISYDEKKNTVTVSGPFDPHKLSKKLWCKACKVIKSIKIIPDPPPTPETPKPPPKVEPCKVINDIEIVVCDPPKSKPKPTSPKKPKPEPRKPPVSSDCCRKPCYGECHGDFCCKPCYGECRGGSGCFSCGKCHGCWTRPPMVPFGGTSRGGYQLICEEYPSTACVIM